MPIILDEIPINYTEIPQELLDISCKSRSNFFSWNGQFSPQFIEILIDRYAFNNNYIFDPFLGSGTVLYEASRKNLIACGIELNPSAYFMAKVYELSNLTLTERESFVANFDRIILEICQSCNLIKSITEKVFDPNSIQFKNLLSLLVVLLDVFNNDLTIPLVLKKWGKIRNVIVSLPYSSNLITAKLGDSRNVNIANNSIDLVITSPPYINVFNYHQNYRKSVELLGFNLLKIARQELGSNRKNRSNRLLTLIEYCLDMALVFNELSRICKDNARIIIVVGKESNILSYSFSNSEILYLLATSIFNFNLILRQQRSFKNRFGNIIFEDILHFSNTGSSGSLTNDIILSKAQEIAKSVLSDKLNSVAIKDKIYFEYAITNFNLIQPSEGIK
jgi:DNA modification methylase